jgi:hypothetical protein
MAHIVTFSLTFTGERADQHELDFYDAAEALIGFQRTLALTTHLILNDEIITQAPSLKGASIFALAPEPGSWKILAGISLAATVVFKLGTTPKDTPIGHLIYSAYDYVISQSLGFHVDYSKSLGEQYDALKQEKKSALPQLEENRFDALAEKCETAIKNIHRPIVGKETATTGRISARVGNSTLMVGYPLTRVTYEHLAYTERSDEPEVIIGRVTSYNSNTFKGRVFLPQYGRPVPFELLETARSNASVALITESLSANALNANDRNIGYLSFHAFLRLSKSMALKGLDVTEVSRTNSRR